MRVVAASVLGFTLVLSCLSPRQVVGQVYCGEDDCPLGYQNLFCRKFTSVTKTWRKQPLRAISFDHHMCVVNSGGPINVSGDLTYFMNVRNIPTGYTIFVAAKCLVTLNDAFSGSEPVSYDNGSGAAFGPFTSRRLKRAESYIIEPQLPASERRTFTSPFSAAVDINCDLTFEAESGDPSAQQEHQGPEMDLDVTCSPNPC